MTILVIAANGRTGKRVVKAAQKRGHSVIAFIRHNEEPIFDSGIKVIKGDATHYEDIEKATKGSDAVISTIGHVKGSQGNVQSIAIENCIKAIGNSKKDIKLISLTGNGVRQNNDNTFWLDRFLNWSVKKIDPKRISDGVNHAEILQDSKINWVIVRVLKLTNGQASEFKLTENGPAKLLVSRQEVAEALVDVAESNKWDRKMPVVADA